MKSFKKTAFLFVLLNCVVIGLGACVTTRAQLNNEKAQASGEASPAASAPAEPAATSPAEHASDSTSSPDRDVLQSELARLIGRVDELEQREQKNKESVAQVEALQKKIEELEGKLKASEEKQKAAEESKVDFFKLGKESFAAGKYSEANEQFQKLIDRGTDEPKVIEEATYLNGEAYFKQKEFKKAIVEYSKFTEKFQKSMFHPKALLKIAESFDGLGLGDDAKAFYQELSDKFPKTAEGKLAKKRLTSHSTKKNK